MKKMIVCLTALLLVLPMLATAVTAADDWTVSVRIVGLGEDIYNAEVSVAEGASAGDALAAVEGVEIVGLDSYITEVDGIAAGMFGGWDGWNYRVNGKSPSVGINDYALADGDAVLLSAEDYSGLMETLYLVSAPGMREKVMDGLKQPLDECLDEEDVEW